MQGNIHLSVCPTKPNPEVAEWIFQAPAKPGPDARCNCGHNAYSFQRNHKFFHAVNGLAPSIRFSLEITLEKREK